VFIHTNENLLERLKKFSYFDLWFYLLSLRVNMHVDKTFIRMLLVVAIVVSIAHIFAVAGSPPVVLWHGMGDTCCNPLSLGKIIKLIEKQLTPAPYVHSIRIGSNAEEDAANGYFMNANHQIDYACKLLNADKNLTQGYHAIG
jgi:palmitoyl-protein thioesterase